MSDKLGSKVKIQFSFYISDYGPLWLFVDLALITRGPT